MATMLNGNDRSALSLAQDVAQVCLEDICLIAVDVPHVWATRFRETKLPAREEFVVQSQTSRFLGTY